MNEEQILNDLDERAIPAAADIEARAASRPAPAFDPDRAPTVPFASPGGAASSSRLRSPFFAAAAAAVVALLAAGLWFGTRTDSNDDHADQVISGSIQPYLPNVVPEGMVLAGAGEEDGSGRTDPGLNAFGALTTYGPALDDPRIAVTALRDGVGLDSSRVPDARQVSVGDRTGYLTENSGLGSGFTLEVPATESLAGPSLIIFGPDVDEGLLVEVALGTSLDGLDATVSPEVLPSGWRLLASEPDGLMAASGPMAVMRGSAQTRMAGAVYVSEDQERSLMVSVAARTSESLHTQRLFLAGVETVRIRGHEAVLGHTDAGSAEVEPGVTFSWIEPYRSVQWMERPGEMITVAGLGLSREELVAAAESMEPVEPTRWRELVEAAELGDLEGESSYNAVRVELGRGRFSDGTAWVLRHRTDDDWLELSVALSGGSTEERFAEIGSEISDSGSADDDEAFQSSSTLQRGGRRFAYGWLRDDVTRVEVRRSDGSPGSDAEVVRAEGLVAWVVEVSPDATELVAYADDGTEVGVEPVHRSGEGSAPEPLLPGQTATTVIAPGPGPTTTAGG